MGEKKYTWGGAREGAGRPKKDEVRGQHQVRAYDDEWVIIKRFADEVKKGDLEKCKAFVAEL